MTLSCRFDSTTGIFTAETAGLYEFTAYILGRTGVDTIVYIERNGEEQCALFIEGVDGDDLYITTTCSATMVLVPGDQAVADPRVGAPPYGPKFS